MENIEQLKQDNEKLQERLNNAAKFFREQKVQIETLTKENEELKEKFKNNDIAKGEAELNLDSINKQYKDKFEEQEKEINELKTKSENFETVAANKQKVIEKLESDIESKDKAYRILQDTYNEVFAEKEKITKQYKEQEKFETEVINTKVPELEEKLHALQQTHDDLGVDYDKLNSKYNELLKEKEKQVNVNDALTQSLAKAEADLDIVRKSDQEYRKVVEEQKAEIKKLTQLGLDYVNQINTLKENIDTLKKSFDENISKMTEMQTKYNNLQKIYDELEGHKLAIENDYGTLEDKFKKLEITNLNNEEIIKSYKQELFNEDICKYHKKDINEICDYILDFFNTKNLKGGE